ncbi:ABC transporter permease [Deinococcus metallilatus]|uniref:ABC transport system permease protein n=1 Tax=Deinococcus metallilatus TaxID=1211322 RepID=A0AAJ5F2Z0_9DEIO|nr:ABC transporter permease [Deinococcus metallilatus]MBB5296784.1 putative ABC transport system permease protein [Deinococcus metallilatus]QBY09149.1 ABC transporter permease [Deinococcus metallilatus]RXJ09664.1 ABC transporter permease [Deinococcus metallilatus]TLK24130.1 FtsX-like permease family protein [Deinococcus metallilatus]GMA13814.1 ABC transporter permease [Deinococcus metallilatus]
MNGSDLWSLAWRGLTRRPVRTLLTALGITVAVASMVVFLSLGEGIRKVFTSELGAIGPDVQVSLSGFSQGLAPQPNLPQTVVGDLQKLSGELGITSVTPVVMAVRGSLDVSQSVVLYGLPAAQGVRAVFPNVQAARGRALTAADEGQGVAVVGAKAAKNLHLGVGSRLNLNRRSRVEVVGILAPESGLVDNFIFLPLSTLQRAEGAQGRVSLVALKLANPRDARAVASTISRRLNLEAQTQSDFLSFVDRALRISDAVRFGISLIALIVGGLAVANTVMMGVFERTREFGTLRAIGARPGFVRTLVLTESLLLALVGGVGGLLLGLVGIAAVNAYTQSLAGIDAAALTPRLTLLALGISLLLGLISGLLPARSASRLSITEALGRV